MNVSYPHFIPVADHALLVELGRDISDEISQNILAFDQAIRHATPSGVVEVVPALVNLLVEFDPLLTDHATLQSDLQTLLDHSQEVDTPPQLHVVDVCYDTNLPSDLSAVSTATGQSTEAVINAHLARTYRVGMYGFAPGYAYLTGLDPLLHLPRKATAVRDVTAGSVIIAGAQCLVTTLTMPTGWSIIGHSPTAILRQSSTRPFLFDVGDHVRFNRISQAEYDASATKGMAHG